MTSWETVNDLIGTTFRHYVVGSLLGKGGMGEVYKARDTTLDRDVALKVLSASLSDNADLMARFEREAKTLASLNHPNIAHLYGIEESGGVRAIIMEHVPGLTLKEHLRQGSLPVEEVLALAKQIASGLEAAHDSGVVHRDLKPDNIKITPDGVLKLLDFGLAKAFTDDAAAPNPEDTPTLRMQPTQAGVILGTAGYMSPEQIRGTPIDKRTDIWAFGVVLFEMLTGKRAFTGETVADVLSEALQGRVHWEFLPPDTPAHLHQLIRRCLQRDRRKRLRDIGDAWLLADSAPTPAPSPAASKPQQRLAWYAAVAVLAALALTLAVILWMQPRASTAVRYLNLNLGPLANLPWTNGVSAILSRDGSRVVFLTKDGAVRKLYSRRLDQTESQPLAGSEDAFNPFFSPDGRWVAYFADGRLKKQSLDGGVPVILCPATNDAMGSGSWGDDDQITFAGGLGGLSRVSASGGAVQKLTELTAGEVSHRWPKQLPGGALTFTAYGANTDTEGAIEVLSPGGKRKNLRSQGTDSRYLPTGHLVWMEGGVLFAAKFDPGSLEFKGPPAPVLQDFAYSKAGLAYLDIAGDGTLLFSRTPREGLNTIQWLTRNSRQDPLLSRPGDYMFPLLSPDGRKLALLQGPVVNRDIWIYDWSRATMKRLTFTQDNEYVFVWTPDSHWIIYSLRNTLRIIPADGGESQLLYEGKSGVFIHAISPDGKNIVFAQQSPNTGNDLWSAPLLGLPDHPKLGKPEVFQASPYGEIYASFSPDSKWVAFTSDESGKREVYVRSFPPRGGSHLVSNSGGEAPVWSADGRQLFYAGLDARLMVVDTKLSPDQVTFSKPEVWNEARITASTNPRPYTLSPDGKRIAVLMTVDETATRVNNEVVILTNFFEEVRRRAGK